MDEDMDMDINNLGVEEQESSEEESQPRTRRKVTDCASSSISDATAATVPPPPLSPAEPDIVNSVMQAAAEIELQLGRFRDGNPMLPDGWEYNSRGQPKMKSSLKNRVARTNVIPHHQRVQMTRIEQVSK